MKIDDAAGAAGSVGHLGPYLRLLRFPQYLKNLFIFLPLFFSIRIMEVPQLLHALLAFVSFSAAASAVYVFNDYMDRDADRIHPEKKHRPLASGEVPAGSALTLMAVLCAAGLAASWLINPRMFQLVLLYLAMNALYTLKLKHIPVIDIFIVAMGFVIRILVGGAVTDTKIYVWIVVMTFLLALLIALGKRRDDTLIFLNTDRRMRKAVDGYNLKFIDSAMIIMAAVIIVAYIMYTTSPDVAVKFHTDKLYVTTIFVLLGIMRYMQIIFVEEKGGNPTSILMKDRFIQLAILGWICLFGVIIYS